MNYYILNGQGDKIASFVNEHDRDFCKEALEEYYSDCKFSGYDDVE